MTLLLTYPDTATFYRVRSGGYGNSKLVEEFDDVPVIFLQGTALNRGGNADGVDSDAVCYPDPTSDFVIDNHNRLEGMFLLAPLFGVDSEDGWYRVETVTINRDHLLGNEIDNIELTLKKSSKVLNVS